MNDEEFEWWWERVKEDGKTTDLIRAAWNEARRIERKACARICDQMHEDAQHYGFLNVWIPDIARAIRNRSVE